MNTPPPHSAKLVMAGFTQDEIELCNKRYAECPHIFSYADWCRAYIALNSTKPAKDGGIALDGNLIIKALQANGKKKRGPYKLSKNKYKA